ncbi:MAG: hypothetical protein ACKOXO_06995 [Cyanobium sp.]
MKAPRTLVLNKPKKFNRKTPDRIIDYNGSKGDSIRFNMKSFDINPSEYLRANIGFGDCAAAIRQGASRDEAFLYQYRSGEMFFNENGSEPGLGKGGLICIFQGSPDLGAISFQY